MSNEWELKRIDEVAKVVSGGTPSREVSNFWNGNINWATPTDITRDNKRTLITTKEKITEEGLKSSSSKLLPIGTLLMTSRATLVEIKIAETEVCTNQGFKSLIPLENIDKWFLFYQMKNHKIEYERYGIGTTFLEVNKSDTDRFKLPFPKNKKVQTKIAKILTTIDNIIEKTEEVITKYEAIKQGMMNDLFTRGIGEDGQLRPSFKDAPELYKESALGLIPKEWEVKRLEQITRKIGDGIHATPKYVDNSNYLFINGNNLKNGKIVFSEGTKCVSEQEFKNYYIELNEFTILMSINGTIGNLAFYEGQNIILGKSAAYIISNDKIMSEFLFLYFQTEIVNHFFTNELTGSTIKNLSLASIRNLPTFIIQKDELEVIVLKLNTLDKKIKSEQEFLSKQTQLKKGLMQDLLTGKVSVTL